MPNPNVTTTGTVRDADGIPVEVGKDYGMLTLKIGDRSARLDSDACAEFVSLCMEAEGELFADMVNAMVARERVQQRPALRAVPDAKEAGQ